MQESAINRTLSCMNWTIPSYDRPLKGAQKKTPRLSTRGVHRAVGRLVSVPLVGLTGLLGVPLTLSHGHSLILSFLLAFNRSRDSLLFGRRGRRGRGLVGRYGDSCNNEDTEGEDNDTLHTFISTLHTTELHIRTWSASVGSQPRSE